MRYAVYQLPKGQQLYTFGQSQQIKMQTGMIGAVSASVYETPKSIETDPAKALKPVYIWRDIVKSRNTPGFQADRAMVLYDMAVIFQNCQALRRFCEVNPDAAFGDSAGHYGMRVDTDKYAFLFRLNPNQDENNFQCYCYERKWLDRHLQSALKGIRFITSKYDNLFHVPDGGKVTITTQSGDKRTYTARYIDDTHVELQSMRGSINLFHICQLAETIERNGHTIEPVDAALSPEELRSRELDYLFPPKPKPFVTPEEYQRSDAAEQTVTVEEVMEEMEM